MSDGLFIGIGAGGHSAVVSEIVRLNGYKIAGYLVAAGDAKLGTPGILGTDALLEELYAQGHRQAFVGVGTIRASTLRRQIAARCAEAGFDVPALVHPAAVISPTASLRSGVQVLAGVIVNADSTVGEGVILNTGVIVEHHCTIGDYAHIAPGAVLGGAVTVGATAHVGIGATVIQGVTIGEGATIAAGAVVVRDVPAGVLAMGVPARVVPQ